MRPFLTLEELYKWENRLLQSLKEKLPELEEIHERSRSHWRLENAFYRFYHHSFKVYSLQQTTEAIVAALQALLPDRSMNKDFLRIIREGTGKTFEIEHNNRWHEETRPILEAFFHASAMLEYGIRYAKELETAPDSLPNGWAAVLYLFDLR